MLFCFFVLIDYQIHGLVNIQTILVEELYMYYLNEEIKVHIFPKGVSQKVYIIVRLKIELTSMPPFTTLVTTSWWCL